MKILITGSNGQLGQEICKLKTQHEIIGAPKNEFNILTETKKIKDYLESYKFDGVIHCAAYTKVDTAESNKDECLQINYIGTKNIAKICENLKIKFCFLSTDYVFNGLENQILTENYFTNPINYYGFTKLLGENATIENCSKFFIVRTSWVFGKYGNNFVKTILNKAKNFPSKELQVVNDQIGSPTYTKDLAYFLLDLISTEDYGVYHRSNRGKCSWFDFANEILNKSKIESKIIPIKTDLLKFAAARPRYSYLETNKTNIYELREWKSALNDFLEEIK
ncbi:MAG: dTDP-4-dehydrorhamnose reductase [Caulobacteraceae bacterium]|nr:dTDP-4-dehydrorhamnose reductase [Caulobacteraceae bacterium]